MKKLNWQDAVDFCKELEFAGHSDWRLPSKEELKSLIDDTQHHPALPVGHPFLNVQSSWYWSSSTYASNTDFAWLVDLGVGGVNDYGFKNFNFYVWPVRGGQFDHSGSLIISELSEGQDRFTDNSDGTATDNRTGLIWIKDLDSIFRQALVDSSDIMGFNPCPFCGNSKIYIDAIQLGKETTHFCVCSSCGCEGPNLQTPEASVVAWNTRLLLAANQASQI